MPESHKHPQERPITDRSGQHYPGEIAAGGPATPEETVRRKTMRRAGRENPKEAVEMIIEADPELTRLEIGLDAIWDELLMVARMGLRETVTLYAEVG